MELLLEKEEEESPAGQLADFTNFITLWEADPHRLSLGRAHGHCH